MKKSCLNNIVIPFVIFSFISFWVLVQIAAGELEVVFLDVGQGDSVLVTTPSGFRVLIDGGDGKGSFSRDQAEEVIIPYLRRAGIRKLDAVAVTHPHFDHLGGLVSLLGNRKIEVGEVLDPGARYPSDDYLNFLRAVRDREEIRYIQPRPGELLDWGPEVEVRVLGPLEESDNPNNSSLVLKLTYSEISFLFTGDAEREA
ncbi:MAG: MBL fold metallo-hydrolase, partial [Candidatus Erginobacter occultus]|nr:MBL fold metallo-hydrolase [Candidatus Erginobacter occultus]